MKNREKRTQYLKKKKEKKREKLITAKYVHI